MVYMAEDKQKDENNGKNLSQIEAERVELADSEVFDDESEKKKSRYSFPLGNKMMTMEDEFDSFQRPRSFSDASLSSGRHDFKTLKGTFYVDGKTSMKVFVRRESQVISRTDEHSTIAVAEDALSKAHIDRHSLQLWSRPKEKVLSLDDINDRTVVSQGAPAKPRLPSNYRQYLNEQLKLYHETNDKWRNSGGNLQESHSKSNNLPGKSVERSDKYKNTNQSGKSRSRDTGSEVKIKPPVGNLRRGRSSVSELTSRPSSVIYRHFDPQLQSELLKKELDSLRISKNVRKKSETMRQWIESGSRPKSTSDLHVRFSDEITVKELTDSDKDIEKQRNKILPKQSKSLDISKKDYKTGDNNGDRKTHLAYPQSGAFDSKLQNDSRGRQDDRTVDTCTKTYGSRGPGITRGQVPVRSKSATALGRNRDVSRQAGDWKPLQESQKTQLSKSASNLQRRQNTITKFNYSTVELKRENVRAKYYQSDKKNRIESFSPGLDDVVTAHSKASNLQNIDLRVGANTADLKDTKAIGDNRSDEEKYAALSRSKILHTKSSSFDNQLKQNSGKIHDGQAEPKYDNSLSKHGHKPGAENLAERMKLTFNLDKIAQKSNNTGAQSVHKPKYKDSKAKKGDTDLSYSDSEYIVKKGAKNAHNVPNVGSNTSQQGKIVLRQCRIGEDVVFGLVAVQDSAAKAHKAKPNGNGYLDGQGLVTIRMIPDEQGRFGFNVKGGADQGMPIIVSRVAPNTPADNAIPRLNEGDQVLFINGRDVSQHTHEQVVMFIRASRETHSGELVLKVRPNAYSADDNSDEPDFVYDPETHQISSATSGANALDLSLKLLEESLESGAALAQFEQLYRKKPGMTMNIARLETNVPKNRYRDISPYDQTRVMIKNGNSGDYINANYVNMEIPVSGILNRYIAAQGPLPTTCIDFWQMVWEQQSTLVVMLTTKVERGRIKCHQYWPDLYETSDYGHLQITCVKEEESASFAFREFNLTHVESQEERHISHMQYIAWPDHGVPDDPADFLDFVQKVRQKRVGLVEPSIVHCSAGIGRTGVLITMETAMCLIEANQPVYPLSIVRQMRDQRAMLIQTPNQYKFVCEAIIRCYNEGIVKPLPEYQQR
ncbi:uncharacterized protein LOC123530832 isoform X1 [Mercenaria mercenaria]|uniref:uncharacterized protein LOC123530832 isoform X1 n=1 Tax=Mercenaria mercenaria TaxID=6596 RepID=UPI00234F1748|nr:uncharacterized protein LOC123530832 isoform X1 [Mercenaria mercenaria]XP_053374756.1 uncharacterized protein LOC123530832 isoform X1 [Mercenaria mercenaria]